MPTIEFVAHAPQADLSCVRRGAGEPLLLIMGVAGHHRMWGELFLELLSHDFDVVIFDHRGIGGSTSVESEFSGHDLVEDTLAVLDAAEWPSAHVFGFSLGGTVAELLAVRHSQRVRSLVLGGTWGDPEDVWGDGVLQLAGAGSAPTREEAAQMLFEANVSAAFAAQTGRLEEFVREGLAVRVPTPVVMQQMDTAAAHDAKEHLADIGMPTLVVHGEEDQIIKASAGRRLAEAIPGARFELWAGVGHMFMWEQPARAAEAIRGHALKATPPPN